MKFSASSPSSVSSTTNTTTTFDGNICNSKNATAGCLRGVLRRLLCFNIRPTHPSDHFKEAGDESTECEILRCTNEVGIIKASATPGLVARLMGLDSVPDIDFANSQKRHNSIARSRSMNSVDSWRGIELLQGKNKRVNSTLSFRESPAYLETEEFLILSFENGGGTKELGSNTRKSDHMGLSELKQRKHKNNKRRECVHEKNKENEETCKISDKMLQRMVDNRIALCVSKDSKSNDSSKLLCPLTNSQENSHSPEVISMQNKCPHNKDSSERRRRSRKKKKENCSPIKKVEAECDSENSSPVSVLDFAEFPADLEVPSSVQNSRLISSNSRRTLFEELKSYKNSIPSNTNRLIVASREVKRNEHKCAGSWNRQYKSQKYDPIRREVCKYAEAEMKKSNWVYTEIWNYEEISATFGLEILNQLLSELVDQLSSA